MYFNLVSKIENIIHISDDISHFGNRIELKSITVSLCKIVCVYFENEVFPICTINQLPL